METSLSEQLRLAMARRDHRQSDLAIALGREPSSVSLYLSGGQSPNPRDTTLMKRLAKYLDMPVSDVIQLLRTHKAPPFRRFPAPPRIRIEDLAALQRVVDRLGLAPRLKHFVGNISRQLEVLEEQGYEASGDLMEKLYVEPTIAVQDTRGESLEPLQDSGDFLENEPDLLRAYLRRFEQDRWVRAAIRRVSLDLNAAFDRTPRNEMVLKDARTIALRGIRETLNPAPNKSNEAPAAEAVSQHARALFAGLRAIRYLEDGEDDRIRRRWVFHSGFLINSLLGFPLYVDGLDDLLEGGLLLPSTGGLPVLLEGSAGTGKSTLALQIAAALASQGFMVLIMAAEERLESLLDRFFFLGFRPFSSTEGDLLLSRPLVESRPGRSQIRLATRDDLRFQLLESFERTTPERIAKSIAINKTGWVILNSIPNRKQMWSENNDFLQSAQAFLGTLAQENVRRCLVIDSLDSLGETMDRLTEEKVFQFVRTQADVALLLSERDGDREASIHRRYLCDLSMVLDTARTSHSDHRTIEIVKSRVQTHIRGRHQVAIHGNRGVSVYPSVQSFLSINRRRIRDGNRPQPLVWSVPEAVDTLNTTGPAIDMNELLAGDVSRGDCILLAGPPATHKFPLGLSFLTAGIVHEPDQPVLLISLRQDEPTVLRILRKYPQLCPLTTAHERGRFAIVYTPPDYYSAARFLHRIRGLFRRSPKPFSRILFSTLNQLSYNSPLFEEEKLFVAALIELFRSHNSTSLFLSVDRKEREIENIFDTMLFVERETSGPSERIVLSVGHSGVCNAERNPWVLKRSTVQDRGYLTLMRAGTPGRGETAITARRTD